jgi:uncharacterized protein (TIGR02265 family)
MPKTKASDIVVIRKMLAERGAEAEKSFLDQLTPEVQVCYQQALPSQWIDNAVQAPVFAAAARVLYPLDATGLRTLAATVAKFNFSGVYRIFLQIPTVGFIVKNVARTWRAFYEKGNSRVEDLTATSAVLVVEGFPELTATEREYLCGYYAGILELTGATNIRVRKIEQDPQAWKWSIQWT